MEHLTKDKSNLMKMIGIVAILVCIYLVALTITEIKSYKYIGGGIPSSNVISFEGKGEVSAAPDIATVSFTILDNEKEMKDAQTKVTAKETTILEFLDKSGIAKKDIKAENYSSYPKYDYGTPCYGGYGMPCRQSEAKIIGYEVSEYVTVKVRDLTKVGDVVKGIGDVGVSDLNGPNFSIDKEDELKANARKMAIDDAKAKAEVLSRDLGVQLVRIVSFSENGNVPMMYSGAKDMMLSAVAKPVAESAPSLPTGENKITSNVTITYEIK